MKGVVFVKFAEFVEQTFGEVFWDEMLEELDLASAGIYTTVATYADEELFALIGKVVEKTNLSTEQAQRAFGKWVFKELYAAAPPSAHNFTHVFEFLHAVQNLIHVEVKKLNPEALLPEFTFLEETPTSLSFHYQSPRKMCFFCEGLVYGLAEHTNQNVDVYQPECEHQGQSRCVIKVTLLD